MIMGDKCTRHCSFCNIGKGKPAPVDASEPERIAAAAKELALSYVVVTSVTRDDLDDGGARYFARTVSAVRKLAAVEEVEVLIPDFKGSASSLKTVIEAGPSVLNHNVETVERLHPAVRPQASYQRSLEVLRQAKSLAKQAILTKSGLMLGLGEMYAEVVGVMEDLRAAGCDFLTIGQYLSPSPKHHPVVRYVPPEEFGHYQVIAQRLGFRGVASGPLVRSSFGAQKLWQSATTSKTLWDEGTGATPQPGTHNRQSGDVDSPTWR
jgi:lipoic acid synthetase